MRFLCFRQLKKKIHDGSRILNCTKLPEEKTATTTIIISQFFTRFSRSFKYHLFFRSDPRSSTSTRQSDEYTSIRICHRYNFIKNMSQFGVVHSGVCVECVYGKMEPVQEFVLYFTLLEKCSRSGDIWTQKKYYNYETFPPFFLHRMVATWLSVWCGSLCELRMDLNLVRVFFFYC